MCHNFHIRGNSCLFLWKIFFWEKKYNGEKTTYKEYTYKEINSEKKSHKKGRKNGDCDTNEKKGKYFKVHPLYFSFSEL